MRQLYLEAVQQLVPDFVRHVVGIGWIHVVIKHQAPEQHLPVLADQAHQALPVKLAARAVNHVANVGAVKALAPRNKNLGSNQVFRRQHAH